ncbi:hypothetical protein F8M41_008651 [Gigaspora margarita]|uniref:Uncharacterized protein n=1 Tax=Gigaspora margarita TaxID=4874 RepID=A0A8H4AVJ8_GIGMA|nr:hypothetical protein F8M41_008651 [Gigaspora margarita]
MYEIGIKNVIRLFFYPLLTNRFIQDHILDLDQTKNDKLISEEELIVKMAQEKEFYSKVCVAGSIKFVVDEASEEDVNLSENDKFSCNLATILARDREVVAVNLKLLPSKCKVYIAKNGAWRKEDYEYVNKIKEILINVS